MLNHCCPTAFGGDIKIFISHVVKAYFLVFFFFGINNAAVISSHTAGQHSAFAGRIRCSKQLAVLSAGPRFTGIIFDFLFQCDVVTAAFKGKQFGDSQAIVISPC